MDIERNTQGEGKAAGFTVLGVVAGRVDDSNIILFLNNFLEQGGTSRLRSIVNSGVQDPDTQNILFEMCKLFTSYYDARKNDINESILEGGIATLSETSNRYKDNPELMNHFSNWRNARKELIEISKSSAERLDQQFFIVNIARMVGSFVEILNALNSGIYPKFCSIISTYADNIGPKFGFVTKTALQFAPHLRFMGFVSSFLDILESQLVIKRVMNVIKNDEDMFEPLKDWLDETKELNETVKKLLPYQINKEILKSIDDALKELGEEQKIFSAAILSNIMKDPMIHKDKKFMTDAVRFCRTDVVKEWYKRMIQGACPSELDCDLMNLQEELRKLEGADIEVGSTVENSKGMVETVENATKNNVRSEFGRYAIFAMSGMSIYWSLGNIRAGSRHRYSDRLRKLSRKAQSFLNKMEEIGFSDV